MDILRGTTARPWRQNKNGQIKPPNKSNSLDVVSTRGMALGGCSESKANARLIVTAVNAYEPMLEVVRIAQAFIDKLGTPDGYYPTAGAPLTNELRRALAAIAQAKEQSK